MRKRLNTALSLSFVALLVMSAAAIAERRPHEGKIVAIDPEQKTMTVSGEKNDEWTLYWTETTKLKGVTVPELQVGDSIHFDYTEKDGRMWLTELRRTHRAKS
ncbi:MAG TPA: hypothetical protein VE007_08340 [Thermoanaerobaculia bacterium]|nr:hypothetical protein [Thermoanaerobaculia bacterium]